MAGQILITPNPVGWADTGGLLELAGFSPRSKRGTPPQRTRQSKRGGQPTTDLCTDKQEHICAALRPSPPPRWIHMYTNKWTKKAGGGELCQVVQRPSARLLGQRKVGISVDGRSPVFTQEDLEEAFLGVGDTGPLLQHAGWLEVGEWPGTK